MNPPETLEIPLFPLKAVLYPDGLLPVRVFEARYMDMTRECLKSGQAFGVCLIRQGEEVGEATPESIGCLAHIVEFDMQQLGVLNLNTRGGSRFHIQQQRIAEQGLIRATVKLLEAEPRISLPAQFEACAQLLRLVAADKEQNVFAEPHQFDDASWVGFRLSEILPIPLNAKQKLLELDSALLRLEILQRFLEQRGLIGGA